MLRNDELTNELETIRLEDAQERLRPEAVVAAAESPASRLHGYFDWDDEVAGAKWRLKQARTLIRVAVTCLPGSNEEFRMYCSLTPDRHDPDDEGTTGGYRSTVEVMGDEQLRAILLTDALKELRTFEAKYSKLTSLGPVFDAYRTMVAEEEPANRRRKKTRRASKVSKKAKKAKKKAGKKTKKKTQARK